jgi:D-alanine-D-alanine ligase-like ATP-grasp enzyme
MLDDQLNMWLIEINTQPSFNADSPLDVFLKQGTSLFCVKYHQ